MMCATKAIGKQLPNLSTLFRKEYYYGHSPVSLFALKPFARLRILAQAVGIGWHARPRIGVEHLDYCFDS